MNIETPRIDKVKIGPHRIVHVTWHHGGSDRADLTGWIETGGPLLAPLLDGAVFATGQPVDHGSAIQWAGGDDLLIDAAHLLLLARQQKPLNSKELARWQKVMGFSNGEAADLVGVQPSTWSAYRAGTSRIPVAVQIVCRAMTRDPLLVQAYYRPRRSGRPRKVQGAAS